MHGELADVYGCSAPSYAQVKFWVGEFKRGRTSLEDDARSGRPLLKNIDCGYSLEPPCRGGSNEYPKSMF